MKIELIIPCHNDCGKLSDLLDSVKEQTRQPDAIRLVHNGCAGNPYALGFSNKARAVNLAAQHSNADFPVILDADIRLSTFFLESLELNASQIRSEIQTRYNLTLTDSQFQGLVRVVGSEKVQEEDWGQFGERKQRQLRNLRKLYVELGKPSGFNDIARIGRTCSTGELVRLTRHAREELEEKEEKYPVPDLELPVKIPRALISRTTGVS